MNRFRAMGDSSDIQEQSAYDCGLAWLLLAEGDPLAALATGKRALLARAELGVAAEQVKEAFVVTGDAALAIGDTAELEDLLLWAEGLPPGASTRFLRAHTARFRAGLTRDADPAAAERGFGEAAALFREIGMPFYLAVVWLEHAEMLVAFDRADECGSLLAEARSAFEQLEAAPWRERLDALAVGAATAA